MKLISLLFFIALQLVIISCNKKTGQNDTLFSLLEPEQTNIWFNNQITESDSFNIFSHTYMYNGAGLGIGDFNNDGLKDVFFSGNMVDNQLYINKGDLTFEDISESAGIARYNRWCTGVSVIDINGDGYDDIYVSVADIYEGNNSANMLFVNNGDLTFTEMAAAYGIDDSKYSTQAVFFDYDKDGDLDIYVLNNAQAFYSINIPKKKITDGSAESNDRLYRNEGIGENGHPVFKDVTKEAGILIEGHGLGVAVCDINMDGWPDVYAANDFLTNDLLWINNQDGTFTNRAGDYLDHQSKFGMGVDVNDFNNDGLSDIVTLDMMPSDVEREKAMMGAMNYDKFQIDLDFNYQPQYIRNTLQLNNGETGDGNLSFSEVGQLAGIHSTDWSWGPLFADLDNDGMKDLFISNGYPKDIIDLDYIVYRSTATTFSGQLDLEKVKQMGNTLPSIKVPNYIYKNEGNLNFKDVTNEWGAEYPSMSNGAVFCDLDNDGDLDLITNNINQEAFVFKNQIVETGKEDAHYLKVVLKGPPSNNRGIGAKIWLKASNLNLYHDHAVIRGYTSSVDPDVHFGLGGNEVIDSLRILWPDGRSQSFASISADTTLIVDHKNSVQNGEAQPYIAKREKMIFEEVSDLLNIDFRHEETDFVDFKMQPLLQRKFSQAGPALAVGDLNGDGLDDFVVGGSVRMPSYIFFQKNDGSFVKSELDREKPAEDMGILIFDADGDGDNDIYAVSGSNEFFANNENYRDRLYTNDGAGNFSKQPLEHGRESGSCIAAADFDRDGDLDLFVGGRVSPHQYPIASQSFLLENRDGNFVDITEEAAPGIKDAGIISAALWTDFDNDGWTDLIIAGEWTPLHFYRNNGGKLTDATSETGLENTNGWWNSITGADFDMDGDIDYIAGNFGLNNKYKASPETPVQLYAKDFDGNGSIDPVQTYFRNGVEYTEHPRDALIDQMNAMRAKFKTYSSYAEATFADVLDESQLENSIRLKAVNLNTSYIENKGDGTFEIKSLPVRAQFAPVYGMVVSDFNGDGALDLFLTGNSYAMETNYGWQDAFKGALFAGNGDGDFSFVPKAESGLNIKYDSKAAVELIADNESVWLISNNRGPLRAYKASAAKNVQVVRVEPNDVAAILTFKDERRQKTEFYYGSGYLSQSARVLKVPENVVSVELVDFQGNKRNVEISEIFAAQR